MEKNENLKDWLESRLDEDMKSLGFTTLTTPAPMTQNGTPRHSATISFVSGEKAKEMARFYLRQKDKK